MEYVELDVGVVEPRGRAVVPGRNIGDIIVADVVRRVEKGTLDCQLCYKKITGEPLYNKNTLKGPYCSEKCLEISGTESDL